MELGGCQGKWPGGGGGRRWAALGSAGAAAPLPIKRGGSAARPRPCSESPAGRARQGPSRQGPSRQGAARQGPSRQGAARQGAARQGPSRQGPSRQGAARQGPSRQGAARQGPSRQGASRQGAAPLRQRCEGHTARLKMQRCTSLLFLSLILGATLSETLGLVFSAKDKRGWTLNSAGYLLGPHAVDNHRSFNDKHGFTGKREIPPDEDIKAGNLGRPMADENIVRTVIEFLTYLHLKEVGALDKLPTPEEMNQS